MRSLVVLVGLTAQAGADPIRWQAFDGTRVEAAVLADPGQPPRLVLTRPLSASVALPGASPDDTLRVDAVRDDLVIAGDRRAWRFAWKAARLELVASASWSARRGPPTWTRPRTVRNYAAAFEDMRQLLRFEATRPGLERYFGDAVVTVTYSNGQKSEQLPGRELLARWTRAGFPLARGTIKSGGPRCATLPDNYAPYRRVPANDPTGPQLHLACFADDLQVTKIHLTVP